MKHRDRVLTALSHEPPDRCPMQISFTPEFADRLKDDLGMTDRDLHNPHGGGNTYALELAIDQDMLLTSVGWANSYYGTNTYSEDGETYTDEWGIAWKSFPYETPYGTGHYTEMIGHPLADAGAIASYAAPNPDRPALYAEAERMVQAFKHEYWIVGVTVCTIFETAWALRGYEQTLIDFVRDPDFLDVLLDIPFQYHLAAAEKLVKLGVDMIWVGDDVGAQESMLISPATWRRFFKPRMAEFVARLKSVNSALVVAYHSDGYILPIIPDLIEIGVDVLNPIQPRCMDPAAVKRAFGDRLAFWGSIDEQYTLPFGTPDQVRDEVVTRLSTIGEKGGLIIGPTHNVQLDTPLANFWAMVDAIKDHPYRAVWPANGSPCTDRGAKILGGKHGNQE